MNIILFLIISIFIQKSQSVLNEVLNKKHSLSMAQIKQIYFGNDWVKKYLQNLKTAKRDISSEKQNRQDEDNKIAGDIAQRNTTLREQIVKLDSRLADTNNQISILTDLIKNDQSNELTQYNTNLNSVKKNVGEIEKISDKIDKAFNKFNTQTENNLDERQNEIDSSSESLQSDHEKNIETVGQTIESAIEDLNKEIDKSETSSTNSFQKNEDNADKTLSKTENTFEKFTEDIGKFILQMENQFESIESSISSSFDGTTGGIQNLKSLSESNAQSATTDYDNLVAYGKSVLKPAQKLVSSTQSTVNGQTEKVKQNVGASLMTFDNKGKSIVKDLKDELILQNSIIVSKVESSLKKWKTQLIDQFAKIVTSTEKTNLANSKEFNLINEKIQKLFNSENENIVSAKSNLDSIENNEKQRISNLKNLQNQKLDIANRDKINQFNNVFNSKTRELNQMINNLYNDKLSSEGKDFSKEQKIAQSQIKSFTSLLTKMNAIADNTKSFSTDLSSKINVNNQSISSLEESFLKAKDSFNSQIKEESSNIQSSIKEIIPKTTDEINDIFNKKLTDNLHTLSSTVNSTMKGLNEEFDKMGDELQKYQKDQIENAQNQLTASTGPSQSQIDGAIESTKSEQLRNEEQTEIARQSSLESTSEINRLNRENVDSAIDSSSESLKSAGASLASSSIENSQKIQEEGGRLSDDLNKNTEEITKTSQENQVDVGKIQNTAESTTQEGVNIAKGAEARAISQSGEIGHKIEELQNDNNLALNAVKSKSSKIHHKILNNKAEISNILRKLSNSETLSISEIATLEKKIKLLTKTSNDLSNQLDIDRKNAQNRISTLTTRLNSIVNPDQLTNSKLIDKLGQDLFNCKGEFNREIKTYTDNLKNSVIHNDRALSKIQDNSTKNFNLLQSKINAVSKSIQSKIESSFLDRESRRNSFSQSESVRHDQMMNVLNKLKKLSVDSDGELSTIGKENNELLKIANANSKKFIQNRDNSVYRLSTSIEQSKIFEKSGAQRNAQNQEIINNLLNVDVSQSKSASQNGVENIVNIFFKASSDNSNRLKNAKKEAQEKISKIVENYNREIQKASPAHIAKLKVQVAKAINNELFKLEKITLENKAIYEMSLKTSKDKEKYLSLLIKKVESTLRPIQQNLVNFETIAIQYSSNIMRNIMRDIGNVNKLIKNDANFREEFLLKIKKYIQHNFSALYKIIGDEQMDIIYKDQIETKIINKNKEDIQNKSSEIDKDSTDSERNIHNFSMENEKIAREDDEATDAMSRDIFETSAKVKESTYQQLNRETEYTQGKISEESKNIEDQLNTQSNNDQLSREGLNRNIMKAMDFSEMASQKANTLVHAQDIHGKNIDNLLKIIEEIEAQGETSK